MKNRLKKIRKELELTQQEFADKLGVKRNNIAGYEIGSRSPSDAVISLICKEFDISEEWLRTGKGEMFIPLTKDKQISIFINNALKDEPDSFRRRLISSLMLLKEDDWIKLGEIIDSLQIGLSQTKQEQTTQVSKKAFEEKSLDDMSIEELEQEYIIRKGLKPVSTMKKSNLLNSTLDTQNINHENTNDSINRNKII